MLSSEYSFEEFALLDHPETYNGKNALPMRERSLAKVLSEKSELAYTMEENIGGEN